jgi:hypothetical protein
VLVCVAGESLGDLFMPQGTRFWVKSLGFMHHTPPPHPPTRQEPVSVCMVGTGEYTTGFVGAVGGASKSDKGSGELPAAARPRYVGSALTPRMCLLLATTSPCLLGVEPGVVGLTLIDLRARTGIVGRLVLVGVRGGKLAAIRDHMKSAIADRYPASDYDMSMDTFPAPEATDPEAYLEVGG